MRKAIQITTILLTIFSIIIFGAIGFYNYNLPNHFYINSNQELALNTAVKISSNKLQENIKSVSTNQNNETKTALNVWGLFPVKSVFVEKTNDIYLIPSGKVFGVKMFTQGVVVVGLNDIQTDQGVVNPARDAGIKIGDIITEINGEKTNSNDDVSRIIKQSNGQKVNLLVKRKNIDEKVELTPAKSRIDGLYKAGLWVRDSSAGIGTITFINPLTNSFGGLGHPISDVDTGEIMPLLTGDVVNVSISGVSKSKISQAGELIGTFVSDIPIGKIYLNNDFGLFGVLNNIDLENKAIPMALKQNVKVGPAKILSTIEGDKPKEYDAVIEKVNLSVNRQTKNIIIRITDKTLLEKTGGIVRGMSGSPIIQDNKLVGAVTHVFVNDPTRGYGIFAENMYNYSKDLDNKVYKQVS